MKKAQGNMSQSCMAAMSQLGGGGGIQGEVCSRARKAWKDNGTVTEEWLAIQSAVLLTNTAESVLTTEHRIC